MYMYLALLEGVLLREVFSCTGKSDYDFKTTEKSYFNPFRPIFFYLPKPENI